MKLYMYMFDVTMLFYISLINCPNTNTLYTTEARERFFVFRLDNWVQTSGHLCRTPWTALVNLLAVI